MKFNVIFFLVCLFTAYGQFGKNKIQYKGLSWRFIQTSHFDIYFYKGGEAIAEYTADVTEEAYEKISTNWDYNLKRRIPIFVYNSHNDFQQSLVVTSYLDEGIGGVTELFKNRIIIPYEGSYHDFKHVIFHELVHGVMNDMLYGGTIQSLISKKVSQVPLWFAEGLAEWESTGWNTKTDMHIRDAVLNNTLPPLQFLNYNPYHGGSSMFKYIATRYGRAKVREILHKTQGTFSFYRSLEKALGISPERLNNDWYKYLREQYWPEITDKKETESIATKLTDHIKEMSYINYSPVFSPNGDKIAYLSNKDTYMSIYIMDAYTGEEEKQLIEGTRTNNFEELHFLSPGMSWSPDGKSLVFSAKGGDQDYLYIADTETGEVTTQHFDLDGVFDGQWSPNGKYIAFIGNKNGASDIYIFHTETKEVTKITNDVFSDIDPAWSPDSKHILFASDRRNHLNDHLQPTTFKMQTYKEYQYDIYEVGIEDKIVKRITDTEADERSPVYAPNSDKIAFVSDRNGVSNIFFKTRNSDEPEYPVSNLLTGAYQLNFSRDGKQLTFSSFFKSGWDIYSIKNPLSLEKVQLQPTRYILSKNEHPLVWDPGETRFIDPDEKENADRLADVHQIDYSRFNFAKAARFRHNPRAKKVSRRTTFLTEDDYKKDGLYKVRDYENEWSLDFVNALFSYDNLRGATGYYTLLFSDLSGAHSILMNSNFVFSFRNSNIFMQYAYTPNRINYIFNLYHNGFRIRSITGDYHFRTYGLATHISRPFTKFKRIDVGANFANYELNGVTFTGAEETSHSLIGNLSYIHDNILWGSTGPIDGSRFNLTGLYAPKLSNDNIAFTTMKFDYRNYLRIGRRYSLATRFSGGASYGLRSKSDGKRGGAQLFALGGVNNWIFNHKYKSYDGFTSNDRPDINFIQNLSYTEFITPLRGAFYNEKSGRHYALMNLEFRFPFIDYLILQMPPIPLQGIRGAFFFDMGTAFEEMSDFRGFRNGYTEDIVIGYGMGVQAYTPFFGLLRFDVAWRDFGKHTSEPLYYFSLGADF